MKTWNELMQGDCTEQERVIIQLLATTTTHPNYSHLTPWEVLDLHVKAAKEIMVCDPRTLNEMEKAGL